MSLDELKAQFPADLRKSWEIDRILVEEPRPDGSGSRFAIDLRAGASQIQRGMGSGSPLLSRKVPVQEALVAMAPHLEGATIERVDLWGANLKTAELEALLAVPWFGGVRALNLGANALTAKAVTALSKHKVGAQLEDLSLSYNKLGNALAKAAFPALTSLELVFCGVDDDALVALGEAPLPKLRRLVLDGAATHISMAKLAKALHDGEPPPHAQYTASALASFGASPVGSALEQLGLGSLTIDAEQARAIADHFGALTSLELTEAKLTASSVAALGQGGGLGALKRLVLTRSFAPNYGVGGALQAPTEETAAALGSLASSRFAPRLEGLVINQIAVGPLGARALCEGKLTSLEHLEARSCQLGDEGLAVIAKSALPLTELVVEGNGLTDVAALGRGPVGARLGRLNLATNALGDASLAALFELPKLSTLALPRCGLTDLGASALAASRVFQQLTRLSLPENQIGDAGARALVEAAPKSLTRLNLDKNCLTPAAVAHAQAKLGARVMVANQDVSKLPPTSPDNPKLAFAAVPRRTRPVHTTSADGLRKHFKEGQLGRIPAFPDWLFAFPKSGANYEVHGYQVSTDRVVSPQPPIANPLPSVAPSHDGKWLAVRAFGDGVYAVRTEDGVSTRIGDVLTHQKGGVTFCDGHIVVVDADTEKNWEGRLQIFGLHDGAWKLEHSVGGFFKVYDEVASLAGGRMFVVMGSAGLFFCAVRGDQLRYLGRLNKRYPVYDFDGQPTVDPSATTSAALQNVDQLLHQAFATGSSPTTLELPKEAWT